MSTTLAAVRNRMIEIVRGATPANDNASKFVPYREQGDFRDWANQHPSESYRRFSIRTIGSIEAPTVTNTDVEWVWTNAEAVVAYPVNSRHGEKIKTSIDDVITSDLQLIEHRIGTNGYANYAQLDPSAAVLTLATDLEEGDVVTFGVLSLRIGIYRAMA
jgi:hypothetical protein